MVSVGDPTQVQKPEEAEGSEEFKTIWSFHEIFNMADRVDQLLLRAQSSATYAWVENIKTLEQLDEAIVHFPPPVGLVQCPDVLRPGRWMKAL